MECLTDEQRERAASVWWIAEARINRFCRDQPGMRRHRSELTSFAGLYLLRIVASYDPNRGATLESYVTGRMAYLVADWMRSEFGRPDQAPLRLSFWNTVSLSAVVGFDCLGDPILLSAALSDDRFPDADSGSVATENRERVKRLLCKLTRREVRVVELLLAGMSQNEAADALGCSAATVSAIYAGAIERLGGETDHQRRYKSRLAGTGDEE
jgi:RNA polymerase sigma factor (sigma-70 family)